MIAYADMAITYADTTQVPVIKNTIWSYSGESGDITTYDTNTLDTHVTVH
jgi:hypothetical protein